MPEQIWDLIFWIGFIAAVDLSIMLLSTWLFKFWTYDEEEEKRKLRSKHE